MTLREAENSISNIISSAQSYKSAVVSLKSQLLSLMDSTGAIRSNIEDSTTATIILENSMNNNTKVISSISDCISTIDSTIGTLKKDAFVKIMEIVDAYNAHNNNLPKERREPPLSYPMVNI